MVVIRNARKRRARLALAAGKKNERLLARQARVGVGGAERPHAREISHLARDIDNALHRAPDNDNLPPSRLRRKRRRADTRDVRRECRDGDTPLRVLNDLFEALGDVGFRGRYSVADRVRGVRDNRTHALLPEFTHPLFVGCRSCNRRRINLPVPGVNHESERRPDRKRVALRN